MCKFSMLILDPQNLGYLAYYAMGNSTGSATECILRIRCLDHTVRKWVSARQILDVLAESPAPKCGGVSKVICLRKWVFEQAPI